MMQINRISIKYQYISIQQLLCFLSNNSQIKNSTNLFERKQQISKYNAFVYFIYKYYNCKLLL